LGDEYFFNFLQYFLKNTDKPIRVICNEQKERTHTMHKRVPVPPNSSSTQAPSRTTFTRTVRNVGINLDSIFDLIDTVKDTMSAQLATHNEDPTAVIDCLDRLKANMNGQVGVLDTVRESFKTEEARLQQENARLRRDAEDATEKLVAQTLVISGYEESFRRLRTISGNTSPFQKMTEAVSKLDKKIKALEKTITQLKAQPKPVPEKTTEYQAALETIARQNIELKSQSAEIERLNAQLREQTEARKKAEEQSETATSRLYEQSENIARLRSALMQQPAYQPTEVPKGLPQLLSHNTYRHAEEVEDSSTRHRVLRRPTMNSHSLGGYAPEQAIQTVEQVTVTQSKKPPRLEAPPHSLLPVIPPLRGDLSIRNETPQDELFGGSLYRRRKGDQLQHLPNIQKL
jgi:archaellum component FlaC